MLQKIKPLIRIPLRFCFSTTSSKDKLGPEYDKREFDAFKYDYEKRKNYLGYTSEELYGKRYGLKHSPAILKEMKKDNYMLVLMSFLTLMFAKISRDRRLEQDDAWSAYVHRDMSLVREIPAHARK